MIKKEEKRRFKWTHLNTLISSKVMQWKTTTQLIVHLIMLLKLSSDTHKFAKIILEACIAHLYRISSFKKARELYSNGEKFKKDCLWTLIMWNCSSKDHFNMKYHNQAPFHVFFLRIVFQLISMVQLYTPCNLWCQ